MVRALVCGAGGFIGSHLAKRLKRDGFWVRGGQTLGMRAWRIRVVRADGGALTWRQSVARFAAGVVAAAPAGLGLWWSFLDADKRGWHDRWTGTRVVRTTTAGKR